MDKARNVIDLHCDTISECYQKGYRLKNDELRFSLDKLPHGYNLCQCMAVWIPDDLRGGDAEEYFLGAVACFKKQMNEFNTEISQVYDTVQIEQALESKQFAAVLTLEGGSAIAGKLENIKRFFDYGVRIITLTWNAENEICGGSATDLGFTDFGRSAVREMERLKIAVDVSHLSDRGFWQLCEFAKKPFIATHSNSRKICGHARNLTDEMFLEIKRRGGVVGLNYYKSFIREDGLNGSVNDILRHVHHFLALGGEDVLALGSDYDGAALPDYLDGIDTIAGWAESLEKSGIPCGIVDKILFCNANRYFKRLSVG